MHQRTRDSMKKRRKPLAALIDKFNGYADKLRLLKDPVEHCDPCKTPSGFSRFARGSRFIGGHMDITK
jgi:hypothetical protein